MKFLKLTRFSGESIYFNFDEVETFYTCEGKTHIDFQQDPRYYFYSVIVEETPEEIYKMLKELEK